MREKEGWTYDPHRGFIVLDPSLVHDHGTYDCVALDPASNETKSSRLLNLAIYSKFLGKTIIFFDF